MAGLRDYEQWHHRYDDPNSDLSWRLRTIQEFLREALDRHAGPIRILSSCSGEGRDLLEVLGERPDAARMRAVLIEIHPQIAERARQAAAALPAHVEVRVADAGVTDSYRGAVPADLVLLVGIFGNISDADLAATIEAAPALCAPGATLIWTRGRFDGDRNDVIRARFGAAGFAELAYATLESGSRPAIGVVRYEGRRRVALPEGARLFTFVR